MANKEACQWLETALEMEEKGKRFYDKAVSRCENDECKSVFQTLADDEIVHMERINTIYDKISAGEPWCEDWEELETHPDKLKDIFQQMAKEHLDKVNSGTGDLEALDTGIDFESESIKFYRKHLDEAKDEIEKEFLQQMVEEERRHYGALEDMKLYLTDPSSWFKEKEKTLLDGA